VALKVVVRMVVVRMAAALHSYLDRLYPCRYHLLYLDHREHPQPDHLYRVKE
jgi:hypothetical protein